MMSKHPFQKLCITPWPSQQSQILLAASGSTVCSLSVKTGELLGRWPADGDDDLSDEDEIEDRNGDGDQRPHKRRKVDQSQPASLSRRTSDASEASVEIVAERKKGERRRPKVVDEKQPKVSHLLSTIDGKYAIAVTSEDKAVIVFEIRKSGRLRVATSRILPKKVCALRLTNDEKTILAADKFGDVYSLPLHPTPDWVAKTTAQDTASSFTPSATELTVHTKGNLEALRQQRERKQPNQKRGGPNFEHQLLLGHVSLLTDLAVAQGPAGGQQRQFILTADRDEHIRVSRGIPQTYIIEAYCLGHTEFVSKLCIVPFAPNVLVAGNGEPSLRTFHWQTGQEIEIFELLPLINESVGDAVSQNSNSVAKAAVSGIWPVVLSDYPQLTSTVIGTGILLVGYEGLPFLHVFCLDKQSKLQPLSSIQLPANVLDVVNISTDGTILASVDIAHQPFSTKVYQTDKVDEPGLLAFRSIINPQVVGALSSDPVTAFEHILTWHSVELPPGLVENSHLLSAIAESESTEGNNGSGYKKEEEIYSGLGEFLYGLENLRKKRYVPGEDDAGAEIEIEAEADAEGVTVDQATQNT